MLPGYMWHALTWLGQSADLRWTSVCLVVELGQHDGWIRTEGLICPLGSKIPHCFWLCFFCFLVYFPSSHVSILPFCVSFPPLLPSFLLFGWNNRLPAVTLCLKDLCSVGGRPTFSLPADDGSFHIIQQGRWSCFRARYLDSDHRAVIMKYLSLCLHMPSSWRSRSVTETTPHFQGFTWETSERERERETSSSCDECVNMNTELTFIIICSHPTISVRVYNLTAWISHQISASPRVWLID